MFSKLDRWQIGLALLCSALIISGILGLASINQTETTTDTEYSSLEEYLEHEEDDDVPQTPPPGALTQDEVRAIALETLPEKGEPSAYEYEDNEWEAKYNDGTEIKLDAMTGAVLEIEE